MPNVKGASYRYDKGAMSGSNFQAALSNFQKHQDLIFTKNIEAGGRLIMLLAWPSRRRQKQTEGGSAFGLHARRRLSLLAIGIIFR